MPTASRPCWLTASAMPSATRSSASSQPISTHSPVGPVADPDRPCAAGRGRRGGRPIATPLGQMWPRESGSSGLPRTEVDLGRPSRSARSPQMASQRLQTPSRACSRVVHRRRSCHDTPMSTVRTSTHHVVVCRCMDTTQLLKGVLDLAVLAVVDDEDGYGYDIVRRLRDRGSTTSATPRSTAPCAGSTPPARSTSYVVASETGPAPQVLRDHARRARPAQASDATTGRPSPPPSTASCRTRSSSMTDHQDPSTTPRSGFVVRSAHAADLDRGGARGAGRWSRRRHERPGRRARRRGAPGPSEYAAELRSRGRLSAGDAGVRHGVAARGGRCGPLARRALDATCWRRTCRSMPAATSVAAARALRLRLRAGVVA